MKKILLALFFCCFSSTFLFADIVRKVILSRYDLTEAYSIGRDHGVEQFVIDSIIDSYGYWYERGVSAATKDVVLLLEYRNYANYKTGYSDALKTGEKYAEIVQPRDRVIFKKTCLQGFLDGYYSVFNPGLFKLE